MAYTFPLSLAQFFDRLPIQSITFDAPTPKVTSRTRGGEVLTAAIGAALWQGQITLNTAYHRDAEALRALIATVRRPGGSFMICNPVARFPRADPGGAILGAASVAISQLSPGNRELRLNGLPAGYVISDGDYLGFAYGSDPVRQALHRVVRGATAGGAGVTPWIEVEPHIRPGAAVGAAVALVNPCCKAVMSEPTPRAALLRGVATSGMSFDWVQTLS